MKKKVSLFFLHYDAVSLVSLTYNPVIGFGADIIKIYIPGTT